MKTDRLTVQMVVAFIGIACLLAIGGLIVLSFAGRQAPEPLTTLGGAAIGALSSLLARTSTEPAQSSNTSTPGSSSPSSLAAPPAPIGDCTSTKVGD